MTTSNYDMIVIRAGRGGEPAVVRLAALDSKEILTGDVLVAEADGEARAALSLTDGTLAADPLSHTAELITLLRLRANHLANASDSVTSSSPSSRARPAISGMASTVASAFSRSA
jgi:pyruvate/2-oxoglutarate dehydrogenase complex dihydrolipoamide dehydrogenase (E3) component